MVERDRNFVIGSKINTLEESLKLFDKSCLLEQIDINLELVRREKVTKDQHLHLLKSIDKDLLKQSQIHHPDKAIRQKKSDREIAKAQNLQTALNATRTVLKALTEVFLKDIDVHYKYEFFAKLDINTLISEKQIDLEINNVLCKISHLSEIKRVNIVGEIRNFLIKCKKSLESFLHNNKHDFVRHRDNALHHLQKCIEGYEIFCMECKLIVEECSDEKDENTRGVIQNMYEQSLRESKILQDLHRVAKRSLEGTFNIFPIYELRYNGPMKCESVVPKEIEYFVLPFMFYVNVLLMCSVMVDKKSRWTKFKTKIGETLEYIRGNDPEESTNFFKEPALSKAYFLASYFNNKNHYKDKVQVILKEKYSYTPENSIIQETFKETVKEIEKFLAEEFDINTYKEGKSNREQFNERLFELNDSMAEFKEVENNLLEKFKLYERETNEIRKEYSELFGKIEKTDERNIKANNPFPECISGGGTANQTTKMAFDQYREISPGRDENLKVDVQEFFFNRAVSEKVQNSKAKKPFPECISIDETEIQTSQMIFDEYQKILQGEDKISKIDVQEVTCISGAASEKVQRNMKAKKPYPECLSGDGTANQTSKTVFDQHQETFQGRDKNSKADAEGITFFKMDQLHKNPINFHMSELISNEPNRNHLRIDQNNEEYEGHKSNEAVKIVSNDYDEDFSDGWTMI